MDSMRPASVAVCIRTIYNSPFLYTTYNNKYRPTMIVPVISNKVYIIGNNCKGNTDSKAIYVFQINALAYDIVAQAGIR